MANNSEYKKQNVTIRLDRATIEKAKIIAARRSISLSELVARRIELIFGEEESYENAERKAQRRSDLENMGRMFDRWKERTT